MDGLLDRALFLKTQTDSLNHLNWHNELKQIPKDMNAPLTVFNLICSHLGIVNAVLLMLDSASNEYFPVVSKNFDETSRLRFHLTEANISALQEGRSKINYYLSYSDSKVIQNFFFIPFGKHPPQTYFFCAGTPVNKISKSQIESIRQNSSRLAALIRKRLPFPAKCAPLTTLPPLFRYYANQYFIQKNQKNDIYLLAIDAKSTIRHILMPLRKNTNPYKIENELLAFFQMNVTDFGFLFRIHFGEYLALVQVEPRFSVDLIIEHLKNAFNVHFENHKKTNALKVLSTRFFQHISGLEKTAAGLFDQL